MNVNKCYKTNKLSKWIDIFEAMFKIIKTDRNFLKTISKNFNVNYNTLKNKFYKYSKKYKVTNGKLNKIFFIDKRGKINNLLTEDNEKELFNYLNINYILTHKPLNNSMIMIIAKNMFKNTIAVENNNFFSHNWCSLFKKRNNLSTRRIKASKIATTIIPKNKINKFLSDCERLKKLVGNDNFFNFDETSERIANPPSSAIRIKNSKNIKIDSHNNLKENITACITECYNGTFLKTIIIVKGTTNRSFKKYGDIPNNLKLEKSKSGWITFEILSLILKQIYEKTKGLKSVLILDRFPTHTTIDIRKDANVKNIILLYVPEGLTSKYQPLDYAINSILKEKLKYKYTNFIVKSNFQYTFNNFLIDFSNSIIEIHKDTIIKSFDCLKLI